MSVARLAIALLAILAMLSPSLGVSLGEFDSTVAAFEHFTALLEHNAHMEQETDEHLAAMGDHSLLEAQAEAEAEAHAEAGQNPTYSLPYPAVGGPALFHPYSAVNPLAAPLAPLAPLAPFVPSPVHVMSSAAFAASPLSGYFAQAVGAQHAAALGVNPALFPALGAAPKGGYNAHGLTPHFHGYHPGLSNDLDSLGGRPAMPMMGGLAGAGIPGLMEMHSELAAESQAEAEAEAGESPTPTPAGSNGSGNEHKPENVAADAQGAPYGLYPAPSAQQATEHYVRSAALGSLGPHKLQFAAVGSNQLDADFPAFLESDDALLLESHAHAEALAEAEAQAQDAAALEAEAELEADIQALMQVGSEAEVEGEAEAEAESESEGDMELMELESEAELDAESESELDTQLLEAGASDLPSAPAGKGSNPTYVLPYPPVLPGHYSPLFNPYSNVNPLSTPFANLAAQPGAHPGVAAASAAQAASLASVSGHVAGAPGGYPMYPFQAEAAAAAAAGAAAAPVPFSGYAGWVPPSSLNNAPVGDNPAAASLGQFIELKVEAEYSGCKGCEFEQL